ncbi:MAG TPA: XRE family transcriptional regulator [Hyphomicrobiales bacterium]|nr:XRE family transcriptional regulator [Kaistiaceae bacterium]HQF29932.1 XRE family transcriptional regulator [Hyphomicrobiales bacterium]
MAIAAKEVFEKSMTPEERRRAEARAAELIAEVETLQDLRKARDLTQARLAEILGITQDNVSRLEKRTDVLLSTLRSYVEAMGGKLDLIVQFPDRPPVALSGLGRDGEARSTGKGDTAEPHSGRG